MAIMAYLLQEYSNENIDIAKVILMCLIHDIVEIDVGDTYTYDDAAKETQFDEFEAYNTPEAKFAHALDNFQPLLLNNSNNGEDWKSHSVTASQVYGRHGSTKLGSEKLFEVTDQIIKKNIKLGNIRQS